MSGIISISLQRNDPSIPWGFRIGGGNGNGCPIVVRRVTPGTIASNYLEPGDIIIKLGNKLAQELIHTNIDDVITASGNFIEVIIKKRPANSNSSNPGSPYAGSPTPIQQDVGQGRSSPRIVTPTATSPLPSYPTPWKSGSPAPGSPCMSPVPAQMSPSAKSPGSPLFVAPPPPPLPNAGPVSLAAFMVATPPPLPPPLPEPSSAAPWRTRRTNDEGLSPSQQQIGLGGLQLGLGGLSGFGGHNSHQQHQHPQGQFDNLPAALQSTMMKDKKPFTYTPGGIDLSELRSPRMQRRIHYNQMDPPGNLAKTPQPPMPQEQDGFGDNNVPRQSAPPETYPQPRIQILPDANQQMQPQQRMPNTQAVSQQHPARMAKLDASPEAETPTQPSYARSQNQLSAIHQRQSSDPEGQSRKQVHVITPYNSPLNAYSVDNAADAYQAQVGEPMPGYDNKNNNSTQLSARRASADDNFTPYYKEQRPQSRSFRLLQVMTDTTAPEAEGQNADSSPQQKQGGFVRGHEEDEMRFTGLKRNPIPSRAFQSLQKFTGEDETFSAPQSVNHGQFNRVPTQQPQPSNTRKMATLNMQITADRPDIGGNVNSGNGIGFSMNQNHVVPPSQQQVEAEPRKYMGGHIPSRSFRLLQAMTGGDDNDVDGGQEINDSHRGVAATEHAACESEPRMYMGSKIPSRSFRMLQAMTEPDNQSSNGVPMNARGPSDV